MTVISFPIPPYSNVPIQPQFYQPRQFIISNITFGQTTTVTTLLNNDFVIGQGIRLLIPQVYGSYQLSGTQSIVIQIPSPNQVILNLVSVGTSPFIPNPYTATITGATQSNPCIVTANNFFKQNDLLTISDVTGMTELNASNWQVINSNGTTFTLNVDSSGFTPYVSGGIATLQAPQTEFPQIIPISDINSGAINTTGRTNNTTFIPGSFINISPQ